MKKIKEKRQTLDPLFYIEEERVTTVQAPRPFQAFYKVLNLSIVLDKKCELMTVDIHQLQTPNNKAQFGVLRIDRLWKKVKAVLFLCFLKTR